MLLNISESKTVSQMFMICSLRYFVTAEKSKSVFHPVDLWHHLWTSARCRLELLCGCQPAGCFLCCLFWGNSLVILPIPGRHMPGKPFLIYIKTEKFFLGLQIFTVASPKTPYLWDSLGDSLLRRTIALKWQAGNVTMQCHSRAVSSSQLPVFLHSHSGCPSPQNQWEPKTCNNFTRSSVTFLS